MVRSACCEKVGLKKGPWTPEEDHKLVSYIEQHGHGSWRALPSKAGLERCGKSCRLRWTNYLRPDIKRGKFSLQEERTIIQLHALLGNRWSAIAAHLAKRTDNEIKNYWNTHLKKRLTKMGIDPTTHKPKTDHHPLAGSASASSAANLSHMAQWESARLEAEARLVRDSKYASFSDSLSRSRTTPPARLVLNRIPAAARSPCLDVLKAWQNSWSSPSVNDKNSTRVVHNMYALMLAQNDDVLESPTSTLTFPPGPPVSPPPPRGCLKDDDIMAAVEAFMGQKRYNNNDDKNLAYSNSIITTTTTSAMEDHDVNIGGDEFEDMLVYENNSNHNLGILSEEGGGFMMSHNYDNGGNDNNIDSSWNNIYTELGESFAT